MTKFFAAASLALTLLVSGNANAGDDPPSPLEAFKASHDAVIDLVHKKAGNKAIEKVVDDWFDFHAMAEEATIVSFAQGTLTVKIGDKEEKIMIRGVKILDAEGKELTAAARREALGKKDAKIDIKKEGDKVVEIKFLK